MSDRKSPVKLSGDQEYSIYKYVIENRCVYQIEDQVKFRVPKESIAKEINLLNLVGEVISGHHVKTSVERVIAWQKRLDKLPAVPQETVELDQLKIFKTKATREIEELKAKLETQQKEIERLTKLGTHKVDDIKFKLDRIKAIINS